MDAVNAGQWLDKAVAYLTKEGVPEARANAEFMMAETLKTGRSSLALHSSRVPTDKQQRQFWTLVERRGRRIPLAYLLGTQPFMGLEIKVTTDALIPRPETEEMVAEAVRLLEDRAGKPLTILELGTGTGCVAVALASSLPHATVYATDISDTALKLALENALAHHVERRIRFVKEDLFGSARLKGWADLVISNPPYIPTAEIDRLEPEVLREPRLALDGGKDGLLHLKAIIAAAPGYLKPGGLLVLEIGSGQGQAVLKLLEKAGFSAPSVRKDAQGHERIAVARRA
jgi:release factor glutamine methyltransferase